MSAMRSSLASSRSMGAQRRHHPASHARRADAKARRAAPGLEIGLPIEGMVSGVVKAASGPR